MTKKKALKQILKLRHNIEKALKSKRPEDISWDDVQPFWNTMVKIKQECEEELPPLPKVGFPSFKGQIFN